MDELDQVRLLDLQQIFRLLHQEDKAALNRLFGEEEASRVKDHLDLLVRELTVLLVHE